jgi:hypothetical protein
MIGKGWTALITELESELAALDEHIRLTRAEVGADGLLELRASVSRDLRKRVRSPLAAYEARAASTCEICGRRGWVSSGFVVRVLCDECSSS